MKSFAEGMAEILAKDAQIVEHRVAVDQLNFGPDALRTEDAEFPLTPDALERLCGFLPHRPKVPASYLRSLPQRLRADVLGHHLREGFDGDGSLSLFLRGSELIGVGRADLARLTGGEVLEATAEGMGGQEGDLEITRLSTAKEAFRCDVITHRAEREVRRGDMVIGGVHIDHSLTGEYATRVEGYFYRLVCANGAMHRECLGARRTPRTRRLPAADSRAKSQQREQIKRLAAEALNTLSSRFQGLERLTEERVDFEHLAGNWIRRTRLSPRRLMPLLQQAYAEEGGDGTAYGVMNAFTRVATHDQELSGSMRDVLARLAGLLAFGHSRLCTRCWSVIAASN